MRPATKSSSVSVPFSSSALIRELSGYYDQSLARELPDLEAREEKLRVSGFPYCGLKSAYEKMADIKNAEQKSAFSKVYYTTVGTAAHTALQRWLGTNGRIWGDWKCYKCKHEVKFSNCRTCPKCKHEMEYEEFTVRAFRNVSGHLDGVYEDSRGKFWVIDYKTSSCKAIYAHRKSPEPFFPYAKNRVQIMSYCGLIEHTYDIKIEGWALLYISRDDPLRTFEIVGDRISDTQKASVMKKIKSYDRQYGVVQNLCSVDDIDYLIERKTCKTVEFYNEFMKGFNGCPLEALCFTKRLPQFMDDTFEEYASAKKCK